MDFTQEQITEILSEFSSKKENGYQTILKIALEAMMKSERDEFNLQSKDVQTRVRLYENYPFEFHQCQCSRDFLDWQFRLITYFIYMQRFISKHVHQTRFCFIRRDDLSRGFMFSSAGQIQSLH